MNTTLKNIIAVIAGIVAMYAANMGTIMISGSIIPPPEGADFSTPEGIEAAMSIMQPKHFIMPFFAHALGSFFGALVVASIAASHKLTYALVIGCLHLIGGIAMVTMVGGPLWFILLDLIVAYIPMALLGYKLARK